MSKKLVVSDGIKVHRDEAGRVSLTDLWKQAGGADDIKPIHYTRSDRCEKLCNAHLKGEKSSPLASYKGNGGGTYAIEEIALDYCAWIDPTLALRVQRAFISLSKGDVQSAMQQTTFNPTGLRISNDTVALMTMINNMALVEHRQNLEAEKLEALRADFTALTEKIKVEAEYVAVVGYFRMKGIPLTTQTASQIGRRAASLSRERGIEIGRVNHQVFGEVNTYHKDVLDEVFADWL